MSTPSRAAPSILIASDNADDAALVKKLLAGAFENLSTSTVADKAVEDFERQLPQVLVLAFNELQKAERYCLGLYRLSSKIASHPHRTVILCDKQEVRQVAELCVKQSFDDYVLFWPMNHDAHRLGVSVHHALRELSTGRPTAAEFAAQARRLSELQALLDRQMALGGRRIEVATSAIDRAEQDIGVALDEFSQRLSQGALPDVVEVKDAAGLDSAMTRFKREEIGQRFSEVIDSVQPLKRWADEFKQDCAPHLEAVRVLGAMADRIRPTVLIVDDDDFQHKMVATILAGENCHLMFAASGAEALSVMRKTRPDLILMDVLMPDMDGIEVTRRLKAVPEFAGVVVIMLTGKSEGSVVADSLSAGAVDFVVKPFDRNKLIAKVARWSRPMA
ncbi:MAG: response regulator [Burkholderiaceae bacterium]|nr:response regulator [Burkholderiaceae bacterium]